MELYYYKTSYTDSQLAFSYRDIQSSRYYTAEAAQTAQMAKGKLWSQTIQTTRTYKLHKSLKIHKTIQHTQPTQSCNHNIHLYHKILHNENINIKMHYIYYPKYEW
jgi:hypothetical protein